MVAESEGFTCFIEHLPEAPDVETFTPCVVEGLRGNATEATNQFNIIRTLVDVVRSVGLHIGVDGTRFDICVEGKEIVSHPYIFSCLINGGQLNSQQATGTRCCEVE